MACPFIENIVDEGAALIRRELNLRRERTLKPRLDVFSFPDHFLFERYRFSLQSLQYLHTLLQPHITNITHRGHALTSEQTLCVALHFFAKGSFLYNVGDAEQLSKATVSRAVRKVCLALKHFIHTFVKFPGHKPLGEIKEEFHRIAGFPDVIGCINGVHIPIKAPSKNERHYVNRNSSHSINVQIISDASNIITNVEAKWPGSVSDSRIYRASTISKSMEDGHFDGFLLGDSDYPCTPTLLTPYPDPEPGPQLRFNVAHSRTRARVDMTIGLLKSRFRCLSDLRVTPERACDIIVACVVLHNIAELRGEQHPTLRSEADDETVPGDETEEERAARDAVCQNHFTV